MGFNSAFKGLMLLNGNNGCWNLSLCYTYMYKGHTESHEQRCIVGNSATSNDLSIIW